MTVMTSTTSGAAAVPGPRPRDASGSNLAAAEFAAPDTAPGPVRDTPPAPAVLPQRRLAAGEFGDW